MLPCFHRSGLKTMWAETKSYSHHASSNINFEMASEGVVSLTKTVLCQSIKRIKKKISRFLERWETLTDGLCPCIHTVQF